MKNDRAAKLTSVDMRRAACGYRISQTTCAACVHALHVNGHCQKNNFVVNLDRGLCNDFQPITRGPGGAKFRTSLGGSGSPRAASRPSSRGHAGRVTVPASVGASVPLARKTITRKTK